MVAPVSAAGAAAAHDESAVIESPHSSPFVSPHPSRRPSIVAPRPVPHHSTSSLSRRSSLASGPRPITRAEYDGDVTPSLLSRAGSPVLPLANEKVQSRKSSFVGQHPGHHLLGGLGGLGGFSALDTRRELRHGSFIGSVDCGTTSTRFIIFDEQAKIITEHQTEYPQILPHAGWHEQDPVDLIDSVREVINNAVEKLEWMGWHRDSVKGIGITNQRETTVAWSKSTGKPLCNAIVWDDTRTVTVVRQFEDKLEAEGIAVEGADGKTEKATGRDALVGITGIPLSTYFSAVKLRWMLDHHKAVADAHERDDLAFGTVDSWFVYNLTGGVHGGIHIMDVTNASRTLLLSLKTLQFHKPLLDFFGFRESILPKIVSSAEVYGEIAASMDTILTGVPIAGIAGDQQAALVGNKCFRRGEAKNTYGTGSFVLFNTGEDIVLSKNGLITTVGYQAGPNSKPVYALEGSIAVAGSAIKWLRDQVNLIQESGDMDMLAGSVPDTGGVYFVTAFAGLLAPYWDRSATGTLIGLTLYSTSAHIARATLEAMAYQSRAVLDVIENESGTKLEMLKVDGGVTNSDLAMQIQANIGGFKVERPSMRESTALGAALLAGHALGLFGWDLNKPETLKDVNTADTYIFEPEIDAKTRRRMIRGWDRAVERARAWRDADNEREREEQEAEYEREEGL
ncbi:Glycerol kinase [Vanrija albida]|uniref:glycerol kinase n=1 Tax=Vanrija albida TaxID=181172 RepID=A0ABR3QDV6_9TREE